MPGPDPSGAPNRRPIATRQWRLFQRLARWLADGGVTPNAISCSSIAFAGGAAAAFVGASYANTEAMRVTAMLIAAGMIQLRLIANLLDGLVAVEGGKATPTGDLYNEVPDRIADTLILVGAGFAPASSPWLGAAAAIAAMFVAYIRAMGASLGAGQVFVGPMAKQHRMAVTTIATVASVLPIAYSKHFIPVALSGIALGSLVTAWRRLQIIAARLREAKRS